MPLNFRQFLEGLRAVPKATSTADTQGELEASSVTGKLAYHNGTTVSPVVTEAHAATLTNKTIDGDNNTVQDLALTSIKTVIGDANKALVRDASGIPTSSFIVNANVDAAAAITRTKLASGTAYRIIANDAAGVMSENADIPGNRAVIADVNGQLAGSTTSATELGYVTGVTSSIQTQFAGKVAGPGTSVDSEVALFSGTGGQTIKRATGTGYVKTISGVYQTPSATIPRADIAAGTADYVIINNGSGNLSSESQLAVTRGGTGLGTLTANNVILGNGTSAPTFVAPSTAGNVLTSTGSVWVSSPNAASPNESDLLQNLGLSASVSANALTIALKQADGSTNPAASPSDVRIGFRSSTATSGAYNVRSSAAATSVVVSSGSTLGQASGVATYTYIYAIDNAGTIELAVSSALIGEGSLVSTTAEGGAGAADSVSAIYSTTARSSVPIRLIGRMLSSQATAGTWASSPTELSLIPFVDNNDAVVARYRASTSTVTTASTVMVCTTKDIDTHNSYSTSTGLFTVPVAGTYLVTASFEISGSSSAANTNLYMTIRKTGVNGLQMGAFTYQVSSVSLIPQLVGTAIVQAAVGDTLTVVSEKDTQLAATALDGSSRNYINIVRMGP